MDGRSLHNHQPPASTSQAHEPPPLQPSESLPKDSATHKDRHVLRVKRKRNADPIDAFIVATAEDAQRKKARTGEQTANDEPAESIARVFQRIDTVESSAFDTALRSRATLDRLRDDLRSTHRQSPKSQRPAPPQIAQERREDQIASHNVEAKAARYKVVSRQRQVFAGGGGDDDDGDGDINLLDVEQQADDDDEERERVRPSGGAAGRFIKSREDKDDVVSSLMPMVQEYLKVSEGDDYVYDLYYAQTNPLPTTSHNHRVAELTFDQDPDIFMHDRRRGSDSDTDDSDRSNNGDDYDSNAEDYYGNFYPDASDLENSDDSDDDECSSSDDDYHSNRDW
ncbi:hypothetical protein HDU87_003085 [Geranomyces variabilis]|uniref:Probable RNA polymerase II nuclear localization protein SLC7A6OS n=1 Tax=Geranomyces variabilis TaxID=109894 RepID=A0AAD5XMV4_9FUNG|nr:hypothetical protein HDU87_003085 [Geranomyces variabilis]